MGLFSFDLAIDLGTANIIISTKDKGIVVDEPSVVAVRHNKEGKNVIVAVGTKAKNMLGKAPRNIKIVRPMRDGVIADFTIATILVKHFIQKIHKRTNLIKSIVLIGVPQSITHVERKAVIESVMSVGARKVYLIDESMAAAIGLGIPIQDPIGHMVVDIGGGTTDIGVISLGGLVLSKSIKIAGDRFDKNIVEYVKQRDGLIIGDVMAEEIKIKIGSAICLKNTISTRVKGRDSFGLLSSIVLTSDNIECAIRESLKEMVTAIKNIIEEMPPDLACDIVDNGITITGGGALLRGIDSYFKDIFKLPIKINEEPLLSVAKGTNMILRNKKLLKLIVNETK
jgi:rod shape-determining protein MreB